jgi:hypothetical protein
MKRSLKGKESSKHFQANAFLMEGICVSKEQPPHTYHYVTILHPYVIFWHQHWSEQRFFQKERIADIRIILGQAHRLYCGDPLIKL